MIKDIQIFLVSTPGEPDVLLQDPYDVMRYAGIGSTNKVDLFKHLEAGNGTYVAPDGSLIVQWNLRYIDERGEK